MLKKINTAELKQGIRYSANVFFDDGQNMLLQKGAPITDYELNVLKKWEIDYVITEGEPIPEGVELFNDENTGKLEELGELVELEEIEEFDEIDTSFETNPQPASETFAQHTDNDLSNISVQNISKLNTDSEYLELHSEYTDIIKNIEQLFEKFKNHTPINNTVINQYAEDCQKMLKKAKSLCVGFILGTELGENNLAISSVNTAILAIILAEHLGLTATEINEITIAALLHDIGMLRIPENILNKTDSLTDIDKQTIAAHTVYGYKAAINEFLYTENIALNIMQHHERWDGKGYPNGIAGNKISLGARIITAADAFVAMITPKPYRDLMLGYHAMKNLLADNSRIFDPAIIKAMIKSLGIFPIGSIVLMNDSSIARVVVSSPEAPMRPFVKILINSEGKFSDKNSKIIDLKESKNLFIVKTIDPRSYKIK